MLINEVIQPINETYYEDLIVAIQNELARVVTKGEKEIDTEELQYLLSQQNFDLDIDDLIKAVDDSGFASSQDKDVIVPKGELPADIDTDVDDPSVDVGNMAGDQAMKDIKSELPQ
ncbi:MAG: hypothetical protein CMO97_01905 [Woeseia sp.]|nr:hypothetical protein [Woeseia sp.]